MVLVVAAVVAGVVWYRVGMGGTDDPPPRGASPATVVDRGADESGSDDAGPSTTGAQGDALVVHVAGAVTTPGVVELAAGARVIDAVEAAGGAVPEADLDRLNLAAKVTDGERILVQRVGDPPAPAASSGGPAGAPSGGTGAAGGLLNVNTASSVELEQLPGIGPALAAAIIAERDRRGGFGNVQELRDVRGIGEKRFADLAELVTV